MTTRYSWSASTPSTRSSRRPDAEPRDRSGKSRTSARTDAWCPRHRLAEVGAEESFDPAPGVFGRLGLRADAGDPQQRTQRPGADFGVVEEGVAGGGVLLHVVDDPCLFECRVEPARGASKRPVAAAVAGHDRAGSGHRFVEVAGKLTVVDCGGVVAVAGGEQGEATAQAEPDDADLAGAVGRGGQVIAGGANVAEGPTVPADHGGHRGD